MKVICDCGAVIDLIEDVDDECESEYGTYVTESSGDIRFWKNMISLELSVRDVKKQFGRLYE